MKCDCDTKMLQLISLTEKRACPDCVIITFTSSCITAGLDLPLHCVYNILWSNPWTLDVLYCHGDSRRPPLWLSQEFPSGCSDLRSAPIATVVLVTTGNRVTQQSSNQDLGGKAHMRWFPGCKLRTANKTQPRVDIIKTTDEKCWEMVLVDLPNIAYCMIHLYIQWML